MTKKERALAVAKILKKEHPEVVIELDFENEMQLAVAVALSAQTTDKKVNEVTSTKLFPKYKTWEDFANANLDELIEDVRGVNFHKGKAERLQKAGQIVIEKFGGKLPKTIQELTQIPGIARKSANVILMINHGIVEGIVVDTHVTRLSERLGFSTEKNAVKLERELMELFPKEYWQTISYALVLHGRYVCKARKPDCANCVLNEICPSAFKC